MWLYDRQDVLPSFGSFKFIFMNETVWFSELIGYSMYDWFSCRWRRNFLSISMSTMPLRPIKPLQNILCIMKLLFLPWLYFSGWDVTVFWGFVAVIFFFNEVGSSAPHWMPNQEEQGTHFTLGRHFDLSSIALRVIWPCKPCHYIRLGGTFVGEWNGFCMQMMLSFGVEYHNSFLLFLPLALQHFVGFGFLNQINHNSFTSYFYCLLSWWSVWHSDTTFHDAVCDTVTPPFMMKCVTQWHHLSWWSVWHSDTTFHDAVCDTVTPPFMMKCVTQW
jgi:hypothetical protein